MADVRALIRELGQVRNALDADIIQIGGVDTGAAGLLSLGTTNATSITIGQGGVTTTFPGDVDIDGTLTIVDGGSLIGDGDVTLGGGDGDIITLGGTFATANDTVNIGTTAIGGDTVVNLRTNMGVGVGKRINFDRTADSESVLLLPDTKDAPVGLAAGMVRVNGGGLLEWYSGAAWLTAAATTTYTLDAAYNASSGASTITTDAGDVTWNLTGAYSFVVDTSAATGAGDGFQVLEGTDYFYLNHTAANSLGMTAVIAAGSINASKGLLLDAADVSRFSVTAASLTISTITSGVLYLTSAGLLTLTDGYKAASTWAMDLVLSDATAEWNTFETNFGEVSLLNAINQSSPVSSGWFYAQNADVDTGTETVDSFIIDMGGHTLLYGSCFWEFFAYNISRGAKSGGYVDASFDETNVNQVFNDVASTNPVFSLDVTDNGDGTYTVSLRATVTSDNWNVQVYRAPYLYALDDVH